MCVLWGLVVGVFVCFVFKLLVSTDKKLSFQVSCCLWLCQASFKEALRLRCCQKAQSCLDAVATSLCWPKHFWGCIVNYMGKIICIEAHPGGPCVF